MEGTRKRVAVIVSIPALERMLKGSEEETIVSDIPRTAVLVGSYYDVMRQAVIAVFEDESYPETLDYCELPIVNPTFTLGRIEREE